MVARRGEDVDAYLERPYVEEAKLQDRYEKWCERKGRDVEDTGNWEDFQRELDEGSVREDDSWEDDGVSDYDYDGD